MQSTPFSDVDILKWLCESSYSDHFIKPHDEFNNINRNDNVDLSYNTITKHNRLDFVTVFKSIIGN